MKAEKRFRELKIERKAIDEESRTVELAFSSEEPYERSFGIEVLDHEQGSADLSRLHNGAPLLVNHDPNDQIGVVENARVDDDKVGRATVRFGKSERAQEIFGDVSDGIRRLVSVGYQVKQVDKAERDKDGLATYRVSSWMPLEISLVAVPADPTVGVGRSADSLRRRAARWLAARARAMAMRCSAARRAAASWSPSDRRRARSG